MFLDEKKLKKENGELVYTSKNNNILLNNESEERVSTVKIKEPENNYKEDLSLFILKTTIYY